MTSGAAAQRERAKFLDFGFARLANGRCRANVVLERTQGERYEGASDGLGSRAGELRCAAEAATRALGAMLAERVRFDLLGVKAVRAFDATVVIVSLSCHNGIPATRLVGSCITDGEVNRCAALAVLNATNRFLGNILFEP